MKEPEKFETLPNQKGPRIWTTVTKEWSDWDKRQAKRRLLTRKIVRIVFFWLIPIVKYLDQWEIRKK